MKKIACFIMAAVLFTGVCFSQEETQEDFDDGFGAYQRTTNITEYTLTAGMWINSITVDGALYSRNEGILISDVIPVGSKSGKIVLSNGYSTVPVFVESDSDIEIYSYKEYSNSSGFYSTVVDFYCKPFSFMNGKASFKGKGTIVKRCAQGK